MLRLLVFIQAEPPQRLQYPPAIRGGYIGSPPANPGNPQIIDAVLKRLCMILYTLKYASKHILKTLLLINTLIM